MCDAKNLQLLNPLQQYKKLNKCQKSEDYISLKSKLVFLYLVQKIIIIKGKCFLVTWPINRKIVYLITKKCILIAFLCQYDLCKNKKTTHLKYNQQCVIVKSTNSFQFDYLVGPSKRLLRNNCLYLPPAIFITLSQTN